MKKQKICIIGGGLTGLITALALSKLNLKVDLITGNFNQIKKSTRTVAISQNNFNYLKKLNFKYFFKSDAWPCLNMKLYSPNEKNKSNEIFHLKNENKIKKQVLFMMENNKLMKHMIKSIKKNKSITFKTKKKISDISSSESLKSIKFNNQIKDKYNLIIICTGNNSSLIKSIFHEIPFERSYEEISVTTTLRHSSLKNNTARQIFLDNKILALLPISNTKTSVVFSVKKNLIKKNKKNNFFLKKEIKFYAGNFLNKIKFNNDLEYKDLNLMIRKTYYKDRILLFGDALHEVHPMAGQGYNMILRDLIILENIIKKKLNLGLDIGSLDVLSEFANETKPQNLVFSLGIDLLKSIFSLQKKPLKNFRNKIIMTSNKNSFAKNIFFNTADKGIRF